MTQVLVVCTANICRSPVAAALLENWMRRVGHGIEVGSAGTRAAAGRPADPAMVAVAASRGVALDTHRSRRLTPDLATSAGLVLTMEARHRDVVSRLAPRMGDRTFALTEAAALADHLPAVAGTSGLPGLVAALNHARPRIAVEITDVHDPHGGPDEDYEEVVDELAGLVDRVGPAIATRLGA